MLHQKIINAKKIKREKRKKKDVKREKQTDGRYKSYYIDNSKHGWMNSLIKGRHGQTRSRKPSNYRLLTGVKLQI